MNPDDLIVDKELRYDIRLGPNDTLATFKVDSDLIINIRINPISPEQLIALGKRIEEILREDVSKQAFWKDN